MPRVRRRVLAVALGLLLALAAAGAGTAVFVRTESTAPIASREGGPDVLSCALVRSDAWSPLPGLEYTGRLTVTLPGFSGGELIMVVGDALPPDVDVEGMDGSYVPTRKERLRSGPGGSGPPPDYWLEEGTPWDAPREVQQVTLLARTDGDRVISVRLGRRAPRVLARLKGYPSWMRAKVCAASLGVPDAFQHQIGDLVVLPHIDEYFGLGWSGVTKDAAAGEVRSMTSHGALLIPSARRGAVHLVVRAISRSRTGREGATLTLRVNDVLSLPERSLGEGVNSYEWDIPANAWLAGTNELLFSVLREERPLTVALSRLELKMTY